MTAPIRIALVGMGKIARDQHLPALARTADFDLVATVDPGGSATGGLPSFPNIDALAASDIGVDAVALCTPPQVRRALAQSAMKQGWHVFLEKPPAATLAEVAALSDAAAAGGIGLFAAWHSRFAAGVAPARAWLAGRTVTRARIVWREDVRRWHPGQDWIWQPGGFGVFDPGINALSIATHILPRPFFVTAATFDMPGNRAAPIAASVEFADDTGAPIAMDLDFRQEGEQRWDIVVETDTGTLTLAQGGAVMTIDGETVLPPRDALPGEYPGLYRRFADIVRAGVADVDIAPLRLVADAFLRGRLRRVEDFVE